MQTNKSKKGKNVMSNETTTLKSIRGYRQSSIELLKVIAIIMIVISHVVQTLHLENNYISYQDYIYDINYASANIQNLILVIFQHFGHWGNTIFFICSAWFLLESDKCSKKKCFFLLAEIWTVSVIILVACQFALQGNIAFSHIIKSFFPTTFSCNWYMTAYILFYAIHPFLNRIINEMSQKTLFRSTFLMSILYIGINVLYGGVFFATKFVVWIAIYFIIAYIKKYLKSFADDFKKNMIVFILGLFGHIGSIVLINFLGLHIFYFSDKMLFWFTECNPFLIAISIAMFNVAKNIHFENKTINYISKLSMLFYIIHENLILRIYVRPAIWNYIYQNYGYNYIVCWALFLSLGVFLFSFVTAVIYKNSIGKMVQKVSDWLYFVLKEKYLAFEEKVLNIEK